MFEPALDGLTPLRVLLVDADERVRESLAGLLSIGDQVIIVGSAGDAATAIQLIESASPSMVIIDPRLPEVDRGIAFIDHVRSIAPAIRILVMNRPAAMEDCLEDCDVDGFVRKTFRPSELLAAIAATNPRVAS